MCRNYTNLSATDIDKLIEIEATLKYYAELTDCYMFIDCMMDNLSHAIVVAEAFPNKEKGLYEKSVIGKFVFESFEPAVFTAFKQKEKSSISRAVTQEGITVEQNVIPIFNEQQQVIAVLIQEKMVKMQTTPKDDFQNMPFALIEHIVEPNSQPIPVVSDLLVESIILTNHENKVIYSNPKRLSFYFRTFGIRKL